MKSSYFTVGEDVQVVTPFWFYDDYYELGKIFTIKEEHSLVDFENFIIKA